jgi:AraC-like DNA-binding protein
MPMVFFVVLSMAFNGRFLLNIAYFAQHLGGNAKELIKLSGSNEDELCKEDCIIQDQVYNAVIERAVEVTNDPYFGLHAGENLNLSAAGLIGQITQSCETVHQALQMCCDFANLGCSVLPMKLEETNEFVKVLIEPDLNWAGKSPVAYKHTADGVVAFTIKEYHSLTRLKRYPIKVHLPWKKSEEDKEYRRVLGCPVVFKQDELAIFLDKAFVKEPIVTANYDLLRVLVQYAEEKSASLSAQTKYVDLVKKAILNLVKPEFPTIEQIAAHLNVSQRTLQRKLQAEGFVFQQIIDELKKEFATKYLKRSDLNISDVAYLLSYADVSAFNRAFKRWYGMLPSAFRIQ